MFGDGVGIGYDIGCSFTMTLQHSPLKELINKKWLCMAINTFHGYAHK